MTAVVAFTGTRFVRWIPRAGLDPSLSDATHKLGAMLYAKAIEEGKKEQEAQETAEQGMFKHTYDVCYRSRGNIMTANVIAKNKNP
jgi:hypothetical protein